MKVKARGGKWVLPCTRSFPAASSRQLCVPWPDQPHGYNLSHLAKTKGVIYWSIRHIIQGRPPHMEGVEEVENKKTKTWKPYLLIGTLHH